MTKKNFASDNYAGIHPDILQAIIYANQGDHIAYGQDQITLEAIELFKHYFGYDIDVYFVATGTAANVLGLSVLLQPYQGVICAESAHINTDEAGAFEKYTGSKLLTVVTVDGKLTIEEIKKQLSVFGDQHRVQPKVISITQSTECGSVYSLDEIKAITDFAHAHNLYVHMDGARLSNAAVSLKASLADMTTHVGIDMVTFGGTKNGMMFGEAIIFFNKDLSADFKYIRKQGMQLLSKMRFISAQFVALLSHDLWIKNAVHANDMAQLLYNELKKIPSIKISRPVQANAVFLCLDAALIALLQQKYYFYIWDDFTGQIRLMTSFNTSQDDIFDFVHYIKSLKRNVFL